MARIRLTGDKELKAALKKASRLGAVKQVVRSDGATLQRKAQRYCPVDTGTLKRSIDLEISDMGFTATSAAHTDYAAYVEYGTRKMEAQPYMGPAYEQTVEEFKSHIKKVME